ncbi:hypothetical protein AB0O67_31025 [Streptomyces sp. NPDC086077]|uniref:hypothetical protein n=1 Tax=Streptomyces sp. NPDC086077 TaxID=3154862 RepID=UPI003440CCC6
MARDGVHDARLVRLTLQPLGIDDTASFVSSMLTEQNVSAEFAAFLHARTEGVPLALEESVRLLHDRGDVIRRGDGWARRRLTDIEVPPTTRDAVLERFGRLGPDTRTVLYAMAVLGGPADHATVRAVAGLPEERAADRMADALACGLLREHGRGQWSFRHSLVCRAVYEAAPAQERRLMHLRAGRVLEGAPLTPVAQLARHFRLAGDVQASIRFTEQAAGLAAQTGDVATSSLLLHALVTTTAVPVETLVRLVMKIQFQSLPGSDPYSEIIASLRSALRTPSLTPEQEGLIRFQTGRVLMVSGSLDAGRLELSKAVPALAPDSLEAARTRILLGIPLGNAQPASEHLRWLSGAFTVAPSLARHERLRLTLGRASALLLLGEDAGWAQARRIPDDPADAQEAAIAAIGHVNVGESAM